MDNSMILRLFTIFGCFLLTASKTGPAHDKVVVCYVSTWAVYRPSRGSFALENIDPNLCTHLVYAFAGLDYVKDAIKSLDPWQDLKDDYGKGGFERITNLKKIHPHLKITLAIGGWNEGSANYSRMAADPERRERFVKSATAFVRKHNFDGLDLDWEYPSQRGGSPSDKENFVLLTKELKESFKPHNLLLTSAIGASKNTIDQAYDVKQLSKYLDFLHIMCYDYGGAWDQRVTANAPLTADGVLSVEYTLDYLVKLGAPPSKLVMGLPFYGRTFVTKQAGNFEDPADSVGFQGGYTRENGFMGYNEICVMVSNKTNGWTKSWDGGTAQALAKFRDEAKGETKVVVYDSTRSIANKLRFAMRHNLAGAMVWSVDTDDFHGDCESDSDTYADFKARPGVKLSLPKRINLNYGLLRTINEATIVALEEIEQEANIEEEVEDNVIPHGDDESPSIARNLGPSVTLIFSLSFLRLIRF